MDAAQIAAISKIQSANSIASDRLLPVVFAPNNIREACATSTVEHMGRLDMIPSRLSMRTEVQGNSAFTLQQDLKVACNPFVRA